MMNRRVVMREDGLVVIQEVGEHMKPVEKPVKHGSHVLFTDAASQLRFGYVLKVEREPQHLRVLDAIAYPNAPSPFDAREEIVPFSAVIVASAGFNYLGKTEVYEHSKTLGKRDIRIITNGLERDAAVGWIECKGGSRTYVDRQENRWLVRSAADTK